ncbi:MAG: hypothetical protein ACLS5C_05495 [Waltera sp.]
MVIKESEIKGTPVFIWRQYVTDQKDDILDTGAGQNDKAMGKREALL